MYRRTTVQFKVFLQLAAMILGGSIEADRRMRMYELKVRQEHRRVKAHTERQLMQSLIQELEDE